MLDLNPNQNHPNYQYPNYTRFGLDEDSEVCLPGPLWQGNISPPDSPVRFPNPRSLSPGSRAQAIARGQREMMEMVENMPETSYELSLKDIVEQRRDQYYNVIDHETQSVEEGEARLILDGLGQDSQGRNKKNKKKGVIVKRQESNGNNINNNTTRRVIVKNGSMNHQSNKGLFINMFFPFSLGSGKKKQSNGSSTVRSSSGFGNGGNHVVKLVPELVDGGGVDRRDWWRKFKDSNCSEGVTSSSSGGESTGRSGSSGSSCSSTAGSLRGNSARRENKSKSYGCWSIFPFRKKKS